MSEPVISAERLSALVEAHQRDVWRYLRALGCDAALAEDIVQEAFIAMLKSGFVERSPAETWAWLRLNAKRRYLNSLRSADQQTLALEAEELAMDHAWDALTPNHNSDARLSMLAECEEKLAQSEREFLTLFYRHELPLREISGLMSTSVDGVKSKLKRIRQALRECIEAKLEGQ